MTKVTNPLEDSSEVDEGKKVTAGCKLMALATEAWRATSTQMLQLRPSRTTSEAVVRIAWWTRKS